MKKYLVSVVRTGISSKEIEVEAGNVTVAKKRALELAPTLEFHEFDSNYEVESVTYVPQKESGNENS